jgi:hypothetical protein
MGIENINKRLWRDERGASLIEYALGRVGPLLVWPGQVAVWLKNAISLGKRKEASDPVALLVGNG